MRKLRFGMVSVLLMFMVNNVAYGLSGGGLTADGSLGTLVNKVGQIHNITGGTSSGNNLFNSCSEFNVETGETANFIGNQTLSNVISRVTGGNNFWLDGTLKTTDTNANLYLMNPDGILFGPNASLDMNGYFSASTADYLKFEDDERFYSDPLQSSVLSTAAPAAFGFLDDMIGGADCDGSILTLSQGKDCFIVGGDIIMNNCRISASGDGRISLVSVGSAGEVELSGAGPVLNGFTTLGDITIDSASDIYTEAAIDVDAGDIDIRAGSLFLSGSADIYSSTDEDFNSGDITILCTGTITLQDSVTTSIYTSTTGAGDAGDVSIAAVDIELLDGSRVFSSATGTGSAGSVTLEVSNSIRIELDQGDEWTYAGLLTGTGGLDKEGTGILTLSGANTYSGVTDIDAGTLKLAGGSAIGDASAVTVTEGATLDLDGTTETVGSLDGAGNVTLGSGTLIAGGDDASTTFSGITSGTGGLNKTGNGALTLTGNNTATGSTTVAAGSLIVDGTWIGPTTVETGAFLKGAGQMASVTVNGTIAPGNSIGTINITGDYTHNVATTYECEIDENGNSDLIDATGSIVINGGTLQVIALDQNASFDPATVYTVMSAGSTVTGTFDTVTDNLLYYTPTVTYTATDVLLGMLLNATNYAAQALTYNQRSTARRLDAVIAPGTVSADLAAVSNELSQLAAADQPEALDHISGEIHASLEGVLFVLADNYQQMLVKRLRFDSVVPESTDGEQTPWVAWGDVSRTEGETDGDGNAIGYEYETTTLAFGRERQCAPGVIVGTASGFSEIKYDGIGRRDWADVDTTHMAVYGRKIKGSKHCLALLSYDYSQSDTARPVTFGDINRNAEADYHAHTLSLYLEKGCTKDRGSYVFQPIASLAYNRFEREEFAESGAGSLSLQVDRAALETLEAALGARATWERTGKSGRRTEHECRARYVYDVLDETLDIQARFTDDLSASFHILGAERGQGRLEVGFGLTTFSRSGNTSVFAAVDAVLSSEHSAYGISAGMNLRW